MYVSLYPGPLCVCNLISQTSANQNPPSRPNILKFQCSDKLRLKRSDRPAVFCVQSVESALAWGALNAHDVCLYKLFASPGVSIPLYCYPSPGICFSPYYILLLKKEIRNTRDISDPPDISCGQKNCKTPSSPLKRSCRLSWRCSSSQSRRVAGSR